MLAVRRRVFVRARFARILVHCAVAALMFMAALAPGFDRHSASATTGPTCGPSTVLKPDGTPWVCSFDEEFSGTSLDQSKWLAIHPTISLFHSGAECMVASPQTIGIADGALRLSILQLPRAIRCGWRNTRFVSGMITTGSKFAQTYGRYEFRAILPAQPALQPALWLYPLHSIGPWPLSGEIDVAELFGLYPKYVLPHLHYVAPNGRKAPGTYCEMLTASTSFHTYTVVWTPRYIQFLYDGQTCFTFSGWIPRGPQVAPGPFNKPFTINLALALTKAQRWGSVAHTAWPSSMYVDYVRVWR